MNRCLYCDAEIEDDQDYCFECGNSLAGCLSEDIIEE